MILELGHIYWTCENTRAEENAQNTNKRLPFPIVLVQQRSEAFWIGAVLPTPTEWPYAQTLEDAAIEKTQTYWSLQDARGNPKPDEPINGVAPTPPLAESVLVSASMVHLTEQAALKEHLERRVNQRRHAEEELAYVHARIAMLRNPPRKVRVASSPAPKKQHRHNRQRRK